MYAAGVVLHVVVCFLMIAAILLQAGKGAEIGAAFGGSSQTVFGSRGPGTFLSKVTIAAATIFFLTSLGLAILSRERTTASTVIDLEQHVIPYTTDLPADTSSPSSSDETPEASPADTPPTPGPTSP